MLCVMNKHCRVHSLTERRPLGIPTVRCRAAQETVRALINPIFDAEFHDNSHGFRWNDRWKYPAPNQEVSSGWRDGRGKLMPTRKGIPQGGVISPLLVNIVLNHLDWRLDVMGYKFVRYADDFVVLCKSKRQAEKALQAVRFLPVCLYHPYGW